MIRHSYAWELFYRQEQTFCRLCQAGQPPGDPAGLSFRWLAVFI